MWKTISMVAGGAALAVALPFTALAVTTDEFPDIVVPADATSAAAQETAQVQATAGVAAADPTGPLVSPDAPDPAATQQADQAMVRQQLRVHAETGPPDGVEPIQQRLHAHDPMGMCEGDCTAGQHMGRGNPNAPMAGAGTGDPADCPNDGNPEGGQGAGNGAPRGRSAE